MTTTADAPPLPDLQVQYRELHWAIARLDAARTSLGSVSGTFWRGPARAAFDAAVATVGGIFDDALAELRSARLHLERAMSQGTPDA